MSEISTEGEDQSGTENNDPVCTLEELGGDENAGCYKGAHHETYVENDEENSLEVVIGGRLAAEGGLDALRGNYTPWLQISH